MSGICGIVRFDGQPVAERDLERQMKALSHLGPDRARHWHEGRAGMGALLMRVTQEDAFDRQPLRDAAAGLTFVSNARIDNREEIAAALAIDADALRAMPDSALLFAAYKTWGADCAERLIGDFVFAAWDAQKNTLTLGRDHMGQRHVFYHRGKGFFAFASERKGLWALPDVPRLLPDKIIARMLLMDRSPDPVDSPLDGIGAVPGGTVLTAAADGSVVSRRYWEPRADPSHENRDEAYYIETYRRVLGEAVACRLRRATAPAGLFMSGGFDSAAICALAGPVVTQQGRKFVAVSSVMPEDYRGTIRHARKWVEMCRRHMPHLDVRYVTREGLNIFTGMEQGFLTTDGHHSPNRYVNDALYSAIASAGARVAMDGHGGDYTLNPPGHKFFVTLLRKREFRRLCCEWRARRRFLRVSHWQLFKSSILANLSIMRRWWGYRAGLALFGPTMPIAREFAEMAIAAGAKPREASDLSMRASMARVLNRLQNAPAHAGSISAAANGLEFTQPFHDKRVVELGLAIPEELYVKHGRERHLARTALKDIYPPEFQTRGPGNDDLGPDFLMMAKSIEPQMLAEIGRMEMAGKLSKYFDFPRMRRMLTRRRIDQHASGNELDTRQAMLSFLIARYVEWFRGDNA